LAYLLFGVLTVAFLVTAGLAFITVSGGWNFSGVAVNFLCHKYMSPYEEEEVLFGVANLRGGAVPVSLRLIRDGSRGVFLGQGDESNKVFDGELEVSDVRSHIVKVQVTWRSRDVWGLAAGRFAEVGLNLWGSVNGQSSGLLGSMPLKVSPIPSCHAACDTVGFLWVSSMGFLLMFKRGGGMPDVGQLRELVLGIWERLPR
jgi:hypothetical protein